MLSTFVGMSLHLLDFAQALVLLMSAFLFNSLMKINLLDFMHCKRHLSMC